MTPWPKHPVIYEINTWVWLGELSRKYDRPVTLAAVPPAEWDELSSFGADAVWLMGVWERSPAGIAIANLNPRLVSDFQRAPPDFRPADNVGSPYCVRRYEVDGRLGGRKGLAAARGELARRGLKLILDFVPNHVAPDHPWVVDHPEYLVQGNADDVEFYRRLLEVVLGDTLKAGEWRLCECSGWPNNSSWRNLVAWCWSREAGCVGRRHPIGGQGRGRRSA